MTGTRIVALVLGGTALLAAGGFVAASYWWQAQGPRIRAEGQAVIAEAGQFGASTDNDGCLQEALGRYDACDDGFACNVKNNIFFAHCLQASSHVAGFCDGLPTDDSIMDSATWRVAQCERYEREGSYCGNFFGEMQKYCESRSWETAD
jgi:hypothetical protein